MPRVSEINSAGRSVKSLLIGGVPAYRIFHKNKRKEIGAVYNRGIRQLMMNILQVMNSKGGFGVDAVRGY
jgi:hypothetical protein